MLSGEMTLMQSRASLALPVHQACRAHQWHLEVQEDPMKKGQKTLISTCNQNGRRTFRCICKKMLVHC